jgi:type I restriction-modification system DNA methylase subunit
MTSMQQRAELQRRIWQIANDVCGTVDGWKFKQYVLGTLFYHFISENFAADIEGGDDSIRYADLPDSVITPEINDDRFAHSVPFEQVAANNYTLSVSSYVAAEDTREAVDIAQLNAELKTTVAKIDQLRRDIDAIIVEIEGEAA